MTTMFLIPSNFFSLYLLLLFLLFSFIFPVSATCSSHAWYHVSILLSFYLHLVFLTFLEYLLSYILCVLVPLSILPPFFPLFCYCFLRFFNPLYPLTLYILWPFTFFNPLYSLTLYILEPFSPCTFIREIWLLIYIFYGFCAFRSQVNPIFLPTSFCMQFYSPWEQRGIFVFSALGLYTIQVVTIDQSCTQFISARCFLSKCLILPSLEAQS